MGTALTPELIGLPAFLILVGFTTFIGGLLKGWWVLGREYVEMKSQRDLWQARAERGTALAERAATVAETVVVGAGGPR